MGFKKVKGGWPIKGKGKGFEETLFSSLFPQTAAFSSSPHAAAIFLLLSLSRDCSVFPRPRLLFFVWGSIHGTALSFYRGFAFASVGGVTATPLATPSLHSFGPIRDSTHGTCKKESKENGWWRRSRRVWVQDLYFFSFIGCWLIFVFCSQMMIQSTHAWWMNERREKKRKELWLLVRLFCNLTLFFWYSWRGIC